MSAEHYGNAHNYNAESLHEQQADQARQRHYELVQRWQSVRHQAPGAPEQRSEGAPSEYYDTILINSHTPMATHHQVGTVNEFGLQTESYETAVIKNYAQTTSYDNTVSVDPTYSPDGFEESIVARLDVQEAMVKLPSLEHDVVRMCFLEDRSLSEVGFLLNLDELSVAVLLEKGIGQLREILGDEYPSNKID